MSDDIKGAPYFTIAHALPNNFQSKLNLSRCRLRGRDQSGTGDGVPILIEHGGMVWASPHRKGEQPLWLSTIMRYYIQPAVKRVGIDKKIGWHTFRHTFSSLVKSLGVDPKVLQELVRHASIGTTIGCLHASARSAKTSGAATTCRFNHAHGDGWSRLSVVERCGKIRSDAHKSFVCWRPKPTSFELSRSASRAPDTLFVPMSVMAMLSQLSQGPAPALIERSTIPGSHFRVRHNTPNTNTQTPVNTLAISVSGQTTNTGSQTTVRANETNRRIKTHLRGRDAGFKERQIVPRSKILADTETDTNARSNRKLPTAMLVVSIREIMAALGDAVENRRYHSEPGQ